MPLPLPLAGHAGLSPLEAVLLGLVEGLTEFLPVSSTGHLLLAERALGLRSSPALDAFTVAVQAGAILAVLGLYRARAAAVLRGLCGRDPQGLRLARNLGLALLPAAAAGLLLGRLIERHLFGLWPVAAAWAVGGLLLLLLAPRLRSEGGAAPGRSLDELDARGALTIGLLQCLALWPGTSRSLAALVGGRLAGLALPAAVEFSFLLGVVTLGAAAGNKALADGGRLLAEVGPAALLLGSLAAAGSAALAVRGLVSWVRSRSLAPFGWYRIALAAGVAALLLSGALPAR